MIAHLEHACVAGAIGFIILTVTWLITGQWLACLPGKWAR